MLPPLCLCQYSTKKLRALDTQKYLGVTLSSDFTLMEYVSTKISLLPGSARILFLNSLILPMFMRTLFGGDKNNAGLMKNWQLLQNKGTKPIVDRLFYSSATDVLEALAWLYPWRNADFFIEAFTFINVLMRSQTTVWIYWHTAIVHGYDRLHIHTM